MSKVRIRHGENEIEVEGTNEFIDKHLNDFYARVVQMPVQAPPTRLKKEILEPTPKIKPSEIPTPAEFFKSKGKTDGISQILIFGKYLEEYRDVTEFSRDDVNKLAKEAKLPKDIHSQYFTNAVKQGLLRTHGRSRYSLTLSAESIISAM